MIYLFFFHKQRIRAFFIYFLITLRGCRQIPEPRIGMMNGFLFIYKKCRYYLANRPAVPQGNHYQ